MKPIRLSAWLALTLLVTMARARADRIDDYVRAEMNRQHIPGLSIAVVRNGRLVKATGYGLASVELNVPARPETVYEIGSITKQFTAALVMMLVEEGKVGLDERITRYLAGLPDAWRDVTVRHLLTHTSGIKSYTDLPTFLATLRKDFTHDEIVKLAAAAPVEFSPGASWSYCNTGYFLLGMILGKVSGKSYADLLKERITGPLGMTATRVNSLDDVIRNRAAGYSRGATGVRNAEYISMTQPFAAGVLVSTVLDMAKWDAALRVGRLLRKSSYDLLWTPVKLNNGSTFGYGFGWMIGDIRGHRSVGHGGGIPGFTTDITRILDNGVTVITFTNLLPCDPGRISHGVAAILDPALQPITTLRPQPDPDPALTARLRMVMTAIANRKDDPAMTPGMQAELAALRPADRQSLTDACRKVEALAYLATDPPRNGVQRNGITIRRIIHYASGPAESRAYWSFYLTEDGQVADLDQGDG